MRQFKKIIKVLLMKLASVLPFQWLRLFHGHRLIIVNYHSLEGWSGDHLNKSRRYRTPEELDRDLHFFKQQYQVLDVQQVMKGHKEKRQQPALLITIDDGLKVVYDQMFPIFKKHGIRPIVFINPDFVDNKDMHFKRKIAHVLDVWQESYLDSDEVATLCSLYGWNKFCLKGQLKTLAYRQRGVLEQLAPLMKMDFKAICEKQAYYLSVDELNELREAGWSIGAHSMDHPPFDELSVEEQQQQAIDSLNWVQKHFDLPYRLFACPSNDKLLSVDFFHGIEKDCELSFGVQGLKIDEVDTHLHRIETEKTGVTALKALKYEYLKYALQRLFKQHKHQRFNL